MAETKKLITLNSEFLLNLTHTYFGIYRSHTLSSTISRKQSEKQMSMVKNPFIVQWKASFNPVRPKGALEAPDEKIKAANQRPLIL